MEIRRNPNPREAFDFTATLIDAPKELQAVSVYGFYVSDCQLTVDKAAGAYTKMSYMLPLEFHKTQDNVYHARVYRDALLEDFPDGTKCKWQLDLVSAYFQPVPNIANMQYSTYIAIDPRDKANKVIGKNHLRMDSYLTRYRFNQKREHDDGKLFTLPMVSNKGFIGEIGRKELTTIRLEIKGE